MLGRKCKGRRAAFVEAEVVIGLVVEVAVAVVAVVDGLDVKVIAVVAQQNRATPTISTPKGGLR